MNSEDDGKVVADGQLSDHGGPAGGEHSQSQSPTATSVLSDEMEMMIVNGNN